MSLGRCHHVLSELGRYVHIICIISPHIPSKHYCLASPMMHLLGHAQLRSNASLCTSTAMRFYSVPSSVPGQRFWRFRQCLKFGFWKERFRRFWLWLQFGSCVTLQVAARSLTSRVLVRPCGFFTQGERCARISRQSPQRYLQHQDTQPSHSLEVEEQSQRSQNLARANRIY